MPQITPFMQSVLDSIDEISTKLDQNIFIKNARTAFKENISQFEIADDEKAKLTANYEAQISIATISEIIKLAKETPLNEAQIANLKKDTDIKIEQEKIAKEQVCGEKAKTKLIIQQIVTEQYRHRDLRASIKIKIASNEVTKQQAKFEEARRHIAIQSNNQNTFMKKADYKVQQLLALAQDDKVVTELHIPVGKKIHFRMRSQDVLHSAYMPHFRAQMNCVPGMVTEFSFIPTVTTAEMRNDPKIIEKVANINKIRAKKSVELVAKGQTPLEPYTFDYLLLCNKICGASHYNMQIKIIVESEADYKKWVKEQKTIAAQVKEASAPKVDPAAAPEVVVDSTKTMAQVVK